MPYQARSTDRRQMDDEKRFTEDEVKAILARAVDLERIGGPIPGVAGSLSLAQVKQVGEEAGISQALVEAALADFEAGAFPDTATWLGPPTSSRSARLLHTSLSAEDVRILLRILENRVGQPGIISEVLGRVTWVTQGAQLTTQVSLSTQHGSTRIDTEQRYPRQMRPLLHLIPAAMGVTLAASIAAPAGIFGGALLSVAVGGGVVGAAVGRGIWELVARTNARRTKRLADEVASAAVELGRPITSTNTAES